MIRKSWGMVGRSPAGVRVAAALGTLLVLATGDAFGQSASLGLESEDLNAGAPFVHTVSNVNSSPSMNSSTLASATCRVRARVCSSSASSSTR